MIDLLTRPEVRRWIYATTTAALALAGAYGLIAGDQLPAWMGLAAAVTGMAGLHTPDLDTPRRLDPED